MEEANRRERLSSMDDGTAVRENGKSDLQSGVADDFPEGGLTAWLTVAGGSMVLFCTFGAIQSFGVFQDYYTRHSLTEHTPSQISWIGSVQLFLLYSVALVSGKLFDAGYFHQTIFAGSLIYIVSFFCLSLAKPHQYYQVFLSQGIGIGIGMGLLFSPTLSIASHHFRARRSIAMGLISAGASLGGIILPIFWNTLFQQSAGFAWGVRGAAFMLLGLLVMANLLMKTRLPSRKETRVDPKNKPNIRKILTDVPYLLAVLGGALVFWGIFFPFFYLQLLAIKHGVDQSLAFYTITILGASSTFGRILPGILADIIGPVNVTIPAGLGCGVLVFAMFKATTRGGVIAFAILFGFFSGAVLSISPPAILSFSTSLNEVGVRLGFAMLIMSFFLLTGTPIDGALVHAPEYIWYRPIVFSGTVIMTGTGLLVVSRFMLAKRRGTWRV